MLKIISKGTGRYTDTVRLAILVPAVQKDTFELKVTERNNSIQRLGRKSSVQGKIVSEGFLHLRKNML